MPSYEDLIEAAIRKEIDVLGRTVAVGVAEDVAGLEVDDDGAVTKLDRDGKAALQDLVEQYQKIGGTVSATLIARAIENAGGSALDLPASLAERIDS